MDRIEVTECSTAGELLDVIGPRSSFWDGSPENWLFRGQDGDYDLLPKAFRGGGKHYLEVGIPVDTAPSTSLAWSTLGEASVRFLNIFREKLDEAGLSVPFEPPPPFSRGATIHGMGEPNPDAYPQVALAQHLGLPTPLLDWSKRAYVAAYFAVPKKPTISNRISVWAIRSDILETPEFLSPFHVVGNSPNGSITSTIVLKTAPRASNPNLHAQSGVFTMIRGEEAPHLDVEKYVKRMQPVSSDYTFPCFPLLRQITCPTTEALRLLKLLRHEGINGSTLFPGYDGIVKVMHEDAMLWPV